MRVLLVFLIAISALAACGTSPTTAPAHAAFTSAQQVLDQLKATGLVINDTLPLTDGDKALEPLYKDHQVFEVLEAGQKRSGMITLCNQKADCDRLFDGLRPTESMGLVHVWRSQDGLVVCMMHPEISPAAAKQIQKVIEALP